MLEIKERVMQIRMVTSCVLAGLVIGSASAASAREVVYPPQMFEENRIIDVTRPPYNADPSGQEDATKAIQLAISQNVGRQTGSLDAMPMILYFPNGTYRISDTLKWQDENGRWRAMLVLQGQSQDGVVIRLADEAADFQEPAEPKPMILTADRAKLEGSDAFHNFVFDLTIDVGVGNPGAVGLDYLANNLAAVRNVTIRSSDPAGAGAIGLYYGARLAKAGCRVAVQTRSGAKAIDRNGLVVRFGDGREWMVDGIRGVSHTREFRGHVDLVLVTLKSTANEALADLLPPVVGPETGVVTLQNGLGNVEAIEGVLGIHPLASGSALSVSTAWGQHWSRIPSRASSGLRRVALMTSACARWQGFLNGRV